MNPVTDLCELCTKLDIAAIVGGVQDGGHEHHNTLAALEAAANGGCRLCALFLWSTLNHFTAAESLATCDDVRYLSFEQISDFFGEEAARNVTSSREPPLGPGWSPEKTMDYHRCLDRKASPGFRVYATFVTLAQDTYGQPNLRTEGCNGLRYCRADADDELRDAMHPNLPCFFDKAGRRVFPWVSMSVLEGDAGNIIGRHLPSGFDTSLCQQWLAECTGSHSSCKSTQIAALPTRVIDVLGSTSTGMVRLVEPQDFEDQYIALSYCWGSNRPFSTTTRTLQQHLAGFDISDMPGLYQDAIKVCRMLEIRYLWIDSLCIIQDDERDWQRECALMDRVYENASLTINVPAASDTTHRFLAQRPGPPNEPCTLTVYWPLNQSYGKVQVAAAHSPLLIYAGEEVNAPLETRAWVTQEYVLSSRVLSFGSQQMYFTCNEGICFESLNGWTTQLDYLGLTGPHREPRLAKNVLVKSGQDKYTVWYTLVSQFSDRFITRGSDKLPALSGLARRFAKYFPDDTYVAGLWQNDLLNGLAWWPRSGQDTSRSLHASTTRQPSWSWISCDQRVDFPRKQYEATDASFNYTWLCRVEKIWSQAKGLDAFGEVQAAELSIRGPIKMKRPAMDILGRSITDKTRRPHSTEILQEEAFRSWEGYSAWVKAEQTCLLLGFRSEKSGTAPREVDVEILVLLLELSCCSRDVFRRAGFQIHTQRFAENDAQGFTDRLKAEGSERLITII